MGILIGERETEREREREREGEGWWGRVFRGVPSFWLGVVW